jgi:cell division protein FtsZ
MGIQSLANKLKLQGEWFMSFGVEAGIQGARIKVIGVGGGGGNAVNTMIRSKLEGVEFAVINTDVQALRSALPDAKIQIGKELTKGLGAGADPDVGRDAALEDRHEIQEIINGADMVFITAGMGGGTGTGGASVVAQIAREMGALTVGVVTKPFNFEGKRRKRHAESGIERLRENVDTLITIPNQKLLQIATPDLSMLDAFRMADEVLVNAVKGISDIINIPGTINVDFADVKAVMSCMGQALMGIGSASGEGRAVEAARQAICSPLLDDVDIEGATGILINVTASSNVSLMEVNEACSIIQDAAHEDANIIFGAVIDENLQDEIRITVIATGFPSDYEDIAERPVQKSPLRRSFHYDRPQVSSAPLVTPLKSKPPEEKREPSVVVKREEPLIEVKAEPRIEHSEPHFDTTFSPLENAPLDEVVSSLEGLNFDLEPQGDILSETFNLAPEDQPSFSPDPDLPKRAAAFAEDITKDIILSELPPMDMLFDDAILNNSSDTKEESFEDLEIPTYLRKPKDIEA